MWAAAPPPALWTMPEHRGMNELYSEGSRDTARGSKAPGCVIRHTLIGTSATGG